MALGFWKVLFAVRHLRVCVSSHQLLLIQHTRDPTSPLSPISVTFPKPRKKGPYAGSAFPATSRPRKEPLGAGSSPSPSLSAPPIRSFV